MAIPLKTYVFRCKVNGFVLEIKAESKYAAKSRIKKMFPGEVYKLMKVIE